MASIGRVLFYTCSVRYRRSMRCESVGFTVGGERFAETTVVVEPLSAPFHTTGNTLAAHPYCPMSLPSRVPALTRRSGLPASPPPTSGAAVAIGPQKTDLTDSKEDDDHTKPH